MPYKQPYNSKTVGMGASRTPKTVMGGQGESTSKPHNEHRHHVTKPTGETPFPDGFNTKKAPGKLWNHTDNDGEDRNA